MVPNKAFKRQVTGYDQVTTGSLEKIGFGDQLGKADNNNRNRAAIEQVTSEPRS
jgi:hypothetical protein